MFHTVTKCGAIAQGQFIRVAMTDGDMMTDIEYEYWFPFVHSELARHWESVG